MIMDPMMGMDGDSMKRDHHGEKNPCYRHGKAGTNIYKIWAGMMSRCYNPKVKIYEYYGGRGITVCQKWHNFSGFYEDMGDRPDKLQLDRIDNSKGYSKENCRWITAKENNPHNKGDIKDTMPGRVFDKWTVLKKVEYKKDHWYYQCRCECGTEKIIAGGELRRKHTTQCLNCKHIAHRGWYERRKKESLQDKC